MTYAKTREFRVELQEVSQFARVLSHPARLTILEYLSRSCTCKSGDISEAIPLSRTTVSQHLQELKALDVIRSEVRGTCVNYHIHYEKLDEIKSRIAAYFEYLNELKCQCDF